MDTQFLLILISGIFVGAAAGYLGSLMVLKKMSLVGDALSHVALPGIGLALIYKINPFFGAFAFLISGIFLVWLIEKRTKLSTEALVGVLFTVSLAVGFLIIPEPELLESLFGNISRITFFDTITVIIVSLSVFLAIYLIYKKIILATVSEDLARAQKIKTGALNLFYLFLVAAVVALGIKEVGALLMGALVIIPAAAAKNISVNLKTYFILSVTIGTISSIVGIILAEFFYFSAGPLIILAAAAVFFCTVLSKRRNSA